MQWYLAAAAIVVFCLVIIRPYHREEARREGREPLTIVEAGRPADPNVPYVWGFLSRKKSPPAIRPGRPYPGEVSTDSLRLLNDCAAATDVPAGLLYAVWTERSGRTVSSWSPDDSWPTVPALVSSPRFCGRCRAATCSEASSSVGSICAQQRRNGQPACDPGRIRVRPDFTVGPLGHDPRDAVRRQPDGSLAWAEYVRDFDDDGVWDPHDLREAMLSAGLRLSGDHSAALRRGDPDPAAWQTAIDSYLLGTGTDGRSGTRIRDLWADWCSVPGRCR
ncbi:MAG: hypothetical protein ABIJ46_00975 [bacterium]